MAHAAMSNTEDNGPARLGWRPSRPGRDHSEQQAGESGDQSDIQPASDGDGDRGGMTGSMDTMFDGLRDAAAEHDGDNSLLPLLEDGAATSKQRRGGNPPA